MDYDKTAIPGAYDRARTRSPGVLGKWMDTVAVGMRGGLPVKRILDLGCGTGRFAEPLRARFDALVVGVDPSAKMLAQARAKPGAAAIRYTRAGAEHLPLKDRSVDLVFLSMVLHHCTDPGKAARECERVLHGGGAVFLRTGTVERIRAYPMTPHFPLAVPIMERTLARASQVRAWFAAAGLHPGGQGVLEQEIAPTHAAFAEQLEAGGDSVLAQLRPEQMSAGLKALRRLAADVDPMPVREPIDYFWFRKTV